MSNATDKNYIDFLARMQRTFKQRTAGRPVFRVDIDKHIAWAQYLASFAQRQYHNCAACRSFINRYAGLVVIADNGEIQSAVWDEQCAAGYDDELVRAMRALRKLAEQGKIAAQFITDQSTLGYDVTNGWRHMHLFSPVVWVNTDANKTAAQAMAEKREDFGTLSRAVREIRPETVDTALQLLRSGKLYRPERALPQAQWFADLLQRVAPMGEQQRKNALWLAVATAPTGFAHVKGSVLNSLLRDVQDGHYSTDAIVSRFASVMSAYRVSSKPVTENQIALAEKAVADLGIAPAFVRRYTTARDLPGGIAWATVLQEPPTPRTISTKADPTGIFDVLRTKAEVKQELDVRVPPKTVTLEKFMRDVLPSAAFIEYRVPVFGRFAALTTAVDADAPPILQWDSNGSRNPVAWNFAVQPAKAEDYSLVPGELVTVEAIVHSPNNWFGHYEHNGKGVFMLLQGAADKRALPGGGLFVEHLRGDLQPYRKTIQAYLDKQVVAGADEPETMAFGIGLLADQPWTELAAPLPAQPVANMPAAQAPKRVHVLLVVDDSGSMGSYLPAARQALTHLIESVGSMPGEVDVTVFKFGTHVHELLSGVPVARAVGVASGLHASSGQTALNDAIGKAIERGTRLEQSTDTAYFLGIVTDGEENNSVTYTVGDVRNAIARVQATGRWTIAFAGAGHNPHKYAAAIGIPPDNVKSFSASREGFEELGAAYAVGAATLASGYRSGARSSTTFFSAASSRAEVGKDLPVFVVTTPGGTRMAYALDRFE